MAICKDCYTEVPLNGHSRGGATCLTIQLRAVKRAANAYLDAHAALAKADGTNERPELARKLADAWIALKAAAL